MEGFRLSPQQARLWQLQQASKGAFYKAHGLVRIEGDLDSRALEQAFNALISRQEILRTGFTYLPGMAIPVQVISNSGSVIIKKYDLRGSDSEEQRQRVERLYLDGLHREFDYQEPSILDVSLIALGDFKHAMIVSLPAMHGDGDSLISLIRELSQEYGSQSDNDTNGVDRIQYADVAEVFNTLLESEETRTGREYWRKKRARSTLDFKIGLESEREDANSFSPAVIKRTISSNRALLLEDLARRCETSLQGLLLTCWAVLIWRLSGRTDITIGTLYDGRTFEGLDSAIGLFARYLPLEFHLGRGLTFADALSQAELVTCDSYDRQNYFNWDAAQGSIADPSRPPFYSVCFDFHRRDAAYSGSGIRLSIEKLFSCIDGFKIRLSCAQTEDALSAEFYYDAALFQEGDVCRLAEQYLALLENVAKDMRADVAALEMLGEEERRLVLHEFQGSNKNYETGTIHQRIEEQAERIPDATALVYEDHHVSYATFNRRANQLAHYLIRKGVGPESLVGISMERSPAMAIGLLATLKAGGGYLPLDPEYPAERLAFMLQDAGAEVLLTQEGLREMFPAYEREVMPVECLWEIIAGESDENPSISVTAENLAYVIYTSGSTGRPKGAMVTHAGVYNCISTMQDIYQLDGSDKFLFKTSLNFDSSVWEYFWPLWVGGSVVITRSRDHLDTRYLVNVIVGQQVTSIYFVPSMLSVFLTERSVRNCNTLRRVICGGESLTAETMQSFFANLSADLHHSYGPTETSIAASEWTCARGWERPLAPIGMPLTNTQILLLDSEGGLVPVKITGEMSIAGSGLGRGYLNRPDITAERFAPHPFSLEPGTRLYKSGDLGRFLPGGEIEFLGRVDHQVKLRGQRIELGEIEAVLREFGAGEAVVVVRETRSDDKVLTAYITQGRATLISTADMTAQLKQRLPDYMVPAEIVILDKMPLTPSGKVDRKGLPEPQTTDSFSPDLTPLSPLQQIIAGLFSVILKRHHIRVDDNFFDLGGHSLLATQLVSRIRELLAVELPLRSLFESPTVSALAQAVERERSSGRGLQSPPILAVSRHQRIPLSYAQQRLWFIQQLDPLASAYNMPAAIRFSGPVNLTLLAQTLSEIARRHEVLRTRLVTVNGQPVQVIDAPAEIELSACDLSYPEGDDQTPSGLELVARQLVAELTSRPFDLERGPVWRASLIDLSPLDHLLVVCFHHVAGDGWSTGLLVSEFTSLYESYREGKQSRLAELEVQYADFAVWQREWLQGEVLQQQIDYWKRQLAAAPVLELPTDRPRPAMASHHGEVLNFSFGADLTARLNSLSRSEGVTLFMTLLAGFQALLARHSGQTDILVGTPVSGRTRGETEGLIGFFVNTLVMRTDLGGSPTVGELLGRVREVSLEAYSNQEVPFEKLVEELQPERSLSWEPLFQVMLILQNAPRVEGEVRGIGVRKEEVRRQNAKFDLTLVMTEAGGEIVGGLEYATDLYEGRRMRRMIEQLRRVMEWMCEGRERVVKEARLLSEAEMQQVMVEWNETRRRYELEKSVEEKIEEEAARRPERVAVVCGEEEVSYGELSRRVGEVARYLRRRGVGPEEKVGVCVERGVEMVVGVLGVMRAGGAFVPMDARYPVERVRYMMEDSEARVVVTQERVRRRMRREGLEEGGVEWVSLDREWGRDSDEGEGVNPAEAGNQPEVHAEKSAYEEKRAQKENLAYVIYTSGSTGRPKGVGVERRALTNFVESMSEQPGMKEGDVWLAVTSLSFDISILEMMLPLVSGAKVVIASGEEVGDVERLMRLVEQSGATHMQATPSGWRVLIEGGWRGDKGMVGLCGGEAMGEAMGEELEQRCAEVWNMYGPTETTIWSSVWKVRGAGEGVKIGRAIGNTEIYILDERQEAVGIGIEGEVYIGGEGLARGYVKEREKTAERFVASGKGEGEGRRMYRTGDVGRWSERGEIEYRGRVDEQVKVRGYRIEPGEIEGVMEEQEWVKECAVAVRGEGDDKRLVAYVVASGKEQPRTSELRQYLLSKLPDYMVPAVFVEMSELPLTANGKLNRKALPAPSVAVANGESEEPRTPVEEILSGIIGEVLRVERVGVEENFFELGGHSLLATQAISRVREVLQVELPLRALFESPTIEGLAKAVERERSASRQMDAPAITAVSRDRELPLSYAQQRLWFIQQLEPESAAYNIPLSVRLEGEMNQTALRHSLAEMARRHEVLRTRFESRDGLPVQVIDEPCEIEFPIWDVSELAVDERDQRAREIARQESQRAFDLERGPVWRAALIQLGAYDNVLLLNIHHVASDGWSTGLMIKEFTALYENYRDGKQSQLAELEVQYADFALWQREWLTGEVLEEQMGYWRRQLAGMSMLELPTDNPRPPFASHRGAQLPFILSAELTQQLRTLSRREGVTLFMTLVAAFQTTLGRHAGQQDVVLGTDLANRNRLQTESLIGFFVNQLILRTDLSKASSLRDLLKQVRERTLEAYAHQDVPFEKVVEELQPEREMNRSPLFDVKLVLGNARQEELRLGGVKVGGFGADYGVARFDLTLTLSEDETGVSGIAKYATDLFESSSIERLMGQMRLALEAMVSDVRQPIAEVSLMTAAQRQQMLIEWNDTRCEFGELPCVHELFERQAEQRPDAIAVNFNEQRLSYGELSSRSNQLAHYLCHLGVGPEVCVVLCLERSLEMVVALFGVLKAGGAYLPLDVASPQERLAWMLSDASASILLTKQRWLASLPQSPVWTICLDADWEAIADFSTEPVASEVTPSNLAYLLYTSGSTGQPKAVMIEHRNLNNYLWWCRESLLKDSTRSLPMTTRLTFDAALKQLFTPLVRGGELTIIAEKSVTDPEELLAALRAERRAALNCVPSLWGAIFEVAGEAGEGLPTGLASLYVGGERLSEKLVRRTLARLPGVEIWNLYGPTEVTANTSISRVSEEKRVSIGRPIANTRVYVLDREMRAVGVGAREELYIGGAGVARGYWGRPDLTAEKFVPDGASCEMGARLYRSGDEVRWCGDGDLEFVGRGDEQVKVRGYRIELGEIEAALMKHGAVKQCVVSAREDKESEKRLVAYVVGSEGWQVESQQLREYLRGKLPDYMVPAAFVELRELPLMPNGKIDRKALPAPGAITAAAAGAAPMTAVEEIISGIIGEVLKVERVGVEDNFFELGGHSLLATQVVSRVREALQVEVALGELFESPTVAGLAEAVERERNAGRQVNSPPIEPVGRDRELPLSYSQQRLWFIHQLEPGSAAYHLPLAVRLQGAMNVSALRQSLSEIARRHEVLRTKFDARDGRPMQVIDEPGEIALPVWDISELKEDGRHQRVREIVARETGRPFDLERGPMWRAALVRLGGEDHALLVCLHHVASDGWSTGLLVSEFTTLYESYRQGQSSPLPELEVQYADFAVWQREWLTGEVLEEQIEYWKRQLAAVPVLELPADRWRPPVASYRGATLPLRLSQDLTQGIKTLSQQHGVTPFMTLLAAFNVLLSRYSGQEDISVGSPIANRNRKEVERLIGNFANTLVMRSDLSGNPPFVELLARVREVTLDAYTRQDLPFEKLVEDLQPERNLSHNPLFQVLLGLHNLPSQPGKLPSLSVSRMTSERVAARFDLSLDLQETGEELNGIIEYSTDLFEFSTITRMAGHFANLLEDCIAEPERPLAYLRLLAPSETAQLVASLSGKKLSCWPGQDQTMHELIEAQVERRFDAIAVVYEEEQVSSER